jgi:hypothetical protein
MESWPFRPSTDILNDLHRHISVKNGEAYPPLPFAGSL